jgi:hypothetical protein
MLFREIRTLFETHMKGINTIKADGACSQLYVRQPLSW